jgi:transposase
LEKTVVEDVELDAAGEALIVAVRPKWSERDRCGLCRRRSPGFDLGQGRRRWRALDLGELPCYLEGEAPRARCEEHGVVVCSVPWARHGARFTRSFEDQVAWLAVHTSKQAVAELMRVAWRSVGRICARVMADQAAGRDLFAGLHRIGIDEISRRKGQRYLTVVVCHETGRLVWAAEGADRKTLRRFFEVLGAERCAEISLVSADMGAWIAREVEAHCPKAALCVDPFHVVKLATEALDEVRREVWNDARRGGHDQEARRLKGARYALWKNPERLTERQRRKLSEIQQTNRRLYRAYLLKEQLRQIYRLPGDQAIALLEAWLLWARRCRLPSFVKLAKTITEQRAGIVAAIRHGLSNALVEAVNTKIRLIARRAFGFHSADALIALAMLSLGRLCPPLPGR